MKDYTQLNQKKSNYIIDTTNRVSLKDIFTGLPKPDKKITVEQLFRKFKSMQDTITENMTTRERIEEILLPLTPSEQMHELEKLSMKIRKKNGLKIELERLKTAAKYPRIRK
jgi:hypothetical protein